MRRNDGYRATVFENRRKNTLISALLRWSRYDYYGSHILAYATDADLGGHFLAGKSEFNLQKTGAKKQACRIPALRIREKII